MSLASGPCPSSGRIMANSEVIDLDALPDDTAPKNNLRLAPPTSWTVNDASEGRGPPHSASCVIQRTSRSRLFAIVSVRCLFDNVSSKPVFKCSCESWMRFQLWSQKLAWVDIVTFRSKIAIGKNLNTNLNYSTCVRFISLQFVQIFVDGSAQEMFQFCTICFTCGQWR